MKCWNSAFNVQVECNLMKLNYYLCNCLMGKFDDLLVNKISYFNYDLVMHLMGVCDFWKHLHLKKMNVLWM
jgi:hypothetical protein